MKKATGKDDTRATVIASDWRGNKLMKTHFKISLFAHHWPVRSSLGCSTVYSRLGLRLTKWGRLESRLQSTVVPNINTDLQKRNSISVTTCDSPKANRVEWSERSARWFHRQPRYDGINFTYFHFDVVVGSRGTLEWKRSIGKLRHFALMARHAYNRSDRYFIFIERARVFRSRGHGWTWKQFLKQVRYY